MTGWRLFLYNVGTRLVEAGRRQWDHDRPLVTVIEELWQPQRRVTRA